MVSIDCVHSEEEYKVLCDHPTGPPHVRTESQTLFRRLWGHSSTSKHDLCTKTSVPAGAPQKSAGMLKAPLGVAVNAFKLLLKT